MKINAKTLIIYSVIMLAVMFMIKTGNKAATVIAQHQPIIKNTCIVLDAGHGGLDGGAISCTGKAESGYNLEIALRLNDLFQFLGYKTKMIREKDESIHKKGETISQKKISDLKERVRIVNNTEGALLLSIHQNSFPDEKYSGAQIFYGNTEASKVLAKQLQKGFISTLNPGSRRKEKESKGIYLIDHTTCTRVLIECGFLSNYEEEAKLRSTIYQKEICAVIAASVSTYLSNT